MTAGHGAIILAEAVPGSPQHRHWAEAHRRLGIARDPRDLAPADPAPLLWWLVDGYHTTVGVGHRPVASLEHAQSLLDVLRDDIRAGRLRPRPLWSARGRPGFALADGSGVLLIPVADHRTNFDRVAAARQALRLLEHCRIRPDIAEALAFPDASGDPQEASSLLPINDIQRHRPIRESLLRGRT